MTQAFGEALKGWRHQRRMSQLELGLSAEVSSRHISFLETGRARPSRAMVLRLCDQLEVPRGARNQLLTAAGMAPAYASRLLSEADMRPVRAAVDWLLQRHAPYPAMALDRHWRLVEVNAPARALLAAVGIKAGDSMLTALARNENLRAALENLEEVLQHAVARLGTESAHFGKDPVLDAAAEELSKGIAGKLQGETGILPALVPTRFRLGEQVLSLFSTFTQFGTAEDVALSELKIEMMFPADEAARQILTALAGEGA